MKYFDSHIHFFPDSLAERALAQLSETAGLPPQTDGTRRDSLRSLAQSGIAGGVALHIATSPRQQQAVNAFAAASQSGNLLCFGSLHPDAADAPEIPAQICALGLKGIKLHPDYQGFYVAEPRMYPLYQRIQDLNLPIAFHTGVDPLSPKDVHCTPQGLRRVAKDFPRLKIIAAHMGGAYLPKEAELLADAPNVYLDTAVISLFLDPDGFRRLVSVFGAERIFFASDLPWADPRDIQALIRSAGLDQTQQEQIFYQNACSFFGLNPLLLN